MSRECIKGEIEPVTGKEWEAPRRQALLESMDEAMGHGLGARAERVSPEESRVRGSMASQRKTNLVGAAQPGAQFVQLQMWEPQIGEGTLMQALGVLTCAREPGDAGSLSKAKDSRSRGRIQPFGQRVIRTMATWCEGVFRRYNGVLRRALNVVWQA